MRYAGVIKNDTVDCDAGICVSFWCQGCSHHCRGCHNPQTWDFNGGIELPNDYIERILQCISANGIIRNLSILGGEPLCSQNIQVVNNILRNAKAVYPNIKTFVWTGNLYEDVLTRFPRILRDIDVLIDGPFDIAQKDITLPLRGSPNQRIIDIHKSLLIGKAMKYERNKE